MRAREETRQVSTKLAIVINEQRLRQLMLEFIAERTNLSSDDDTLRRRLLFSQFMLWLQRYQRGERAGYGEREMQQM